MSMHDPFIGEQRVVNEKTGGEKGQKLARFDLIPADVLTQVAEHYGKGAEKYADRNWERGYDWSLSFAALMRHAWAFWNGEDIDPETGSHHMIAVVFHAMALVRFAERFPEFDSRPTSAGPSEEGLEPAKRGHHINIYVEDGSTIDTDERGFRVNYGEWHEWEDVGGEA